MLIVYAAVCERDAGFSMLRSIHARRLDCLLCLPALHTNIVVIILAIFAFSLRWHVRKAIALGLKAVVPWMTRRRDCGFGSRLLSIQCLGFGRGRKRATPLLGSTVSRLQHHHHLHQATSMMHGLQCLV